MLCSSCGSVHRTSARALLALLGGVPGPARVVAVDAGCAQGAPPRVCVAVAGAPGEAVALTLVDPHGTVRVVRLVADAVSSARAVCGCGAACACGAAKDLAMH